EGKNGLYTETWAPQQFNNEVLKTPNKCQQQHCVPPPTPHTLKLCKKTNQEAQHYSEVLASPRMPKSRVQSQPVWREPGMGLL
uniref:Uncharacterized protein n=1 Tax=Neovison vison TaxID=452646 RepID=A0A8C7C502_NEOVI